jgi:hypothetical protein
MGISSSSASSSSLDAFAREELRGKHTSLCLPPSGMTGIQQKVNHSQLLMQWALQLPQLWHCAVTFS